MDLIDLMEDDAPPPPRPGMRRFYRTPTLSVEPQKAQELERCLERHNWRAANDLGAVWYDQYARRWFKFTKHFWDHVEYDDVPERWFAGLTG